MVTELKTSIAKRVVACVCACAFVLSLVPAVAFAAPAQQAEEAQAAVDVLSDRYRNPRTILEYYKNNNVDPSAATTMESNPSATSPYAVGKVSQRSLGQALTTLNFIRFVAGIDDSVELDAEYTSEAQAAALVNAANGQLTHNPQQPSGMSSGMYELGLKGANGSNLYATSDKGSLQQALLGGWLYDSDDQNIKTLGHRRWLLNPAMGKTGFGLIPDSGGKGGFHGWAAMYAYDKSNTRASQSPVAWPAQSMPYELFSDSAAWSLSTGYELDASQVKVTLTRVNDSKTWSFSQSSSDGDFYVDSVNPFGQKGCIIFRPKDIEIDAADMYRVSVTGTPNPISYNVNFFGLEDEGTITSISLDGDSFEHTGSAITPKVTARYYNRILTEGIDYEVAYSNNVNVGTATVTVKGINSYASSPSKTTTFKIVEASSSGSGSGVPTPSEPKGTPVPMYRLYNPNSGEHFYTASEYERAFLIGEGWNNEDVGWIAPSEGDPVYRLYNSIAGEHHYTLSTVERDHLISVGWNDEGIGWYSGGRTPLFRQYNPNAYANNHNYTTSEVERDHLLGIGWNDEGIGWYGIE